MRWVGAFLIAIISVGQTVRLEAQTPPPDPARALFMAGRDLWDDGRYADAERKFREALAKYPKAEQADRTGFYLIETLMKMGRAMEALAEMNKFPSSFPQSKWNSDVQEKRIGLTNQVPPNLRDWIVEIGKTGRNSVMPPPGFPGRPPFPGGDPQIGLAQEALRAVLRNDPERGIEISKERLKANPSDLVVLLNLDAIAESESAAALPLLVSIAKASSGPRERTAAVFWIGRHKDGAAVKTLAEIAKEDSDIAVRRVAIQALASRKEPEAVKALDDFLKTTGQK